MERQGLDLSGLRDIHLPELPSMFPPPPVFFVVLFGLIALVSGIVLLVRYLCRRTVKKAALEEIEKLKTKKPYEAALNVSSLLRRAAVMAFSRKKVAALTGRDWHRFLTETSRKKNAFSGAAGDVLENIQYAPETAFKNIDIRSLLDDSADWIRQNL